MKNDVNRKSDAWAPVSIQRTKRIFDEVHACGACGELPTFSHYGDNIFRLKCWTCGISSDSLTSRSQCVSQWNTLIAHQKSAYANPPIIQITFNEADLIAAIDTDYCYDDACRAAKSVESSFIKQVTDLFKAKIAEAYDSIRASNAMGDDGKNKAEENEERVERG